MEQKSSALDSKIVRFEKNSSSLKGFDAILSLFGSPVVGIGSVLFTLFVVLILLRNSSSNLKVAKITFEIGEKLYKSNYRKFLQSYMRRPTP